MKKQVISLSFFLLLFNINILFAQDSLVFVNPDSNLIVRINYSINHGTRNIIISTPQSKLAYHSQIKNDSRNVSVKIFDINRDGFDDIIIEAADESGFSPFVLINIQNQKFHVALAMDVYFVEYSNLESKFDEKPHKAYTFKDLDGDKINEMIFNHFYSKMNYYQNVVLKLDHDFNFKLKSFSRCLHNFEKN